MLRCGRFSHGLGSGRLSIAAARLRGRDRGCGCCGRCVTAALCRQLERHTHGCNRATLPQSSQADRCAISNVAQ